MTNSLPGTGTDMKRRLTKAVISFTAIVTMFALICFGIACVMLIQSRGGWGAVQTSGTVTEIGTSGFTGRTYTFDFVSRDGHEYSGITTVRKGELVIASVGERVSISYDPADPDDARIVTTNTGVPIMVLVGGFWLTIAVLIAVMGIRRRKSL